MSTTNHQDTDLLQLLDEEQRVAVSAVRKHAETLLSNSPRFRYFTLHGKPHIDNLFALANLFLQAGMRLRQEEAFLLSLSICIHDLGMVVPLAEMELKEILDGKPNATDPAILETFIRDTHHELAENYLQQNANFLVSCGISPSQIANVYEISLCHRKVVLEGKTGFIKYLGAFLRTIDELDLGRNRAPAAALVNNFRLFDATSVWHWYKHNIVQDWNISHTVNLRSNNNTRSIEFRLIVSPQREESVGYWLNQIRRPILRVLKDEGCALILEQSFGVSVDLRWSDTESKPLLIDNTWGAIEEYALSSGRKVVLVIDDEVRKIADLFLPMMDQFHVVFASNARDALQKLAAVQVDLAIVDMQIGSGFIWSATETDDFKKTGSRLLDEISIRSPATKLAVLTGTRHPIEGVDKQKLAFLARKPIDPNVLLRKVINVLS